MEIRRNLKGMHKVFYYVIALILITGLMLMVNLAIFLAIVIQYHRDMPEYVQGGEVMDELTLSEGGYELSDAMQAKMDELNQWAVLLNENGEAIWSYRKPAEIKESYTRSEIARMSRYYLKDYPVYLRVWDDRIMIVGLPKYSMWKYNMEFPILWIEYVKKVWFWIALFDFLSILVLAFFFTRRWSKKREEARIEWIAGISHDIRTPLSMVMGYSDTLLSSGNLSTEEQRQMAVIRHQSIVMKELVEDLNLTSRLEYSMQALRVERVRPAAVLREVAAAFLSDAKEGELEIDMEISGQAEEIWIKADRSLLVRALRNLFHNSLQHSEQQEVMKITLRMWKEGRWCLISFSDNGVGYPPDVLHQLHNRKKKCNMQNIRGLGIVQKVVMAHGGKNRFENNRQGGCFCEMRFRAYTAKNR